jgi:hypothetical protein
MDLEFHPLMQIRLRHEYFSDGNCPPVEIVPSNNTAQLMQSMTIRVVPRDYGIELFYGKQGGAPTPLAAIADSLRLSFWLRPTNPMFYNYTNHLPEGGPPALFYATNHQQDTAKGISFSLVPSAIVSLAPHSFQRDISGAPEDVLITNESGISQGGNTLTIQDNNDAEPKATVDLAGLEAGRYIFVDGDTTLEFVAPVDGYRNGDVGLLSFYLGDSGEGKRSVIAADGTIEPATVTVFFSVRSTIWRYNLIASSAQFSNFSIGNDGNAPGFITPANATRTLPNGAQAAVLVSSSPIPLQAKPTERFQLSFTDESGRIQNNAILLPNAGAESLSRDEVNSDVLYSEIYVYI